MQSLQRIISQLFIGLTTVSLASAQQPTSGVASGVPLSNRVMATAIYHPMGSGNFALDLMVLWRGSSGWWQKDSPSGQGQSVRGTSGPAGYHEEVQQGGVTLVVDVDGLFKTATIGGHVIQLAGANIVLVDSVDSPGGLRIVGTRTVSDTVRPPSRPPGTAPSGVPAPRFNIYDVTAKNPDIFAYLGCAPVPKELKVELSTPGSVVDMFCGRAAGIPLEQLIPGYAEAMKNAPKTRPSSSGSGGFGPWVNGAYWVRGIDADTSSLDLLILLRADTAAKSGGSNGGGWSRLPDGGLRGTISSHGSTVAYSLDSAKTVFTFGEERIPLHGDNVILLDGAGGAGGPKFMKTLSAGKRTLSDDPVTVAFRTSPELFAFLRCDLLPGNASSQSFWREQCNKYGPPSGIRGPE